MFPQYADLWIVGIQLAVHLVCGEFFRRIRSTPFVPMRNNETYLKMNSIAGLALNILILSRNYFGSYCALYLFGCFMSPALTAGSSLVFAFELLVQMNHYNQIHTLGPNQPGNFSVIPCIPNVSHKKRRARIILGTSICVNFVIVCVFLGLRFKDRGLSGLSEHCVMSVELWALIVLFVVYMTPLILMMFLYGIRVHPEYRLVVNFVRITTLWYAFTLAFFLVINWDPNMYASWMTFFDPSLWGILFNAGGTFIPFLVMPVYEYFYVRSSCCGTKGHGPSKGTGEDDSDTQEMLPNVAGYDEVPDRITDIYSRRTRPSATELVWGGNALIRMCREMFVERQNVVGLARQIGYLVVGLEDRSAQLNISEDEVQLVKQAGTKHRMAAISSVENWRSLTKIELQRIVGESVAVLARDLFDMSNSDDPNTPLGASFHTHEAADEL